MILYSTDKIALTLFSLVIIHIALNDALAWKLVVNDRLEGLLLFINEVTGEMRTGAEEAADWAVHVDNFGFPCFYNMRTEVTVYEDPRFVVYRIPPSDDTFFL